MNRTPKEPQGCVLACIVGSMLISVLTAELTAGERDQAVGDYLVPSTGAHLPQGYQSVLQAEEPLRIWTLANGDRSMLRLVNVSQNRAVFLLEDHRQQAFDIGLLCPADREYARQFEIRLEQLKKPNSAPLDKGNAEPVQITVPAELPHCPEIEIKGIWIDDLAEGVAHAYSSGKLCYLETYRKDKLDGPKIQFYPSGPVYCIRFFKDGIPYGRSVTFYENGTISGSISWREGDANGPQFSYFRTGEIAGMYPTVNQKWHGESVHYLPGGSVMGYQDWFNGRQIRKRIRREPSTPEYQEILAAVTIPFGTLWTQRQSLEGSYGQQRQRGRGIRRSSGRGGRSPRGQRR